MIDSTTNATEAGYGPTSLSPDLQLLRPLTRSLTGRSDADVERNVREARQATRRAGRF
ncbi:hypothetical protein [Aliihoeflea sp. 40Bstr573]|uniref:hypothetical protein n=1 Tax=Aliihoeflea sp. 40Bstr573 TaxID=2696467 RepID=UPI00209445F8|nr:hypothetical protein [Aliihoeflea sp. 40Bstr573]MCO6387982.1 hypothetical protein [Aliihoeflea sp. 40Bstr573]